MCQKPDKSLHLKAIVIDDFRVTEPLAALARDLATGSPSLEASWYTVLERLQSLGLDSRRIGALARAGGSPMLLLTFADYCAAERLGSFPSAEAAAVTLHHMVDASPVDLKSWLQALRTLHISLQQQQRSCTLSNALGYIECTAAALSAQPVKPTLSEAVQEMFNTYGFSAC